MLRDKLGRFCRKPLLEAFKEKIKEWEDNTDGNRGHRPHSNYAMDLIRHHFDARCKRVVEIEQPCFYRWKTFVPSKCYIWVSGVPSDIIVPCTRRYHSAYMRYLTQHSMFRHVFKSWDQETDILELDVENCTASECAGAALAARLIREWDHMLLIELEKDGSVLSDKDVFFIHTIFKGWYKNSTNLALGAGHSLWPLAPIDVFKYYYSGGELVSKSNIEPWNKEAGYYIWSCLREAYGHASPMEPFYEKNERPRLGGGHEKIITLGSVRKFINELGRIEE